MKIDAQGWLSGVRRIPSPNYDKRPPHTPITLLVIHSISLPPDQFGGMGIHQLFTNSLDPAAHPYYEQLTGLRVSAHFLIRRTGEIVQYVSCLNRAWHAGASEWKGRTRCNDFSIGIELEGSDNTPFTEIQYRRLALLSRKLKLAYSIHDFAGHAEIAPERKTDPGPYFDWPRFQHSF